MIFHNNPLYFWLFVSGYNAYNPWYLRNRFNTIVTFFLTMCIILIISPNISVLVGLSGDLITCSNNCSIDNSFDYNRCILVGIFYTIVLILNFLMMSLLFSPCVYLVLESDKKTHIILKTLFVIFMLLLSLYLPFLFGATTHHFIENPQNTTISYSFNNTLNTILNTIPNKNCSFVSYSDVMTNECERLGVITIFVIILIIYIVPIIFYSIYKTFSECHQDIKKEMDDHMKIQDV